MSDAGDIRRAVALARHAMEELDRAIAELERVTRPLSDEDRDTSDNLPRMDLVLEWKCPAAKCSLRGTGAYPKCGSWFCPGR